MEEGAGSLHNSHSREQERTGFKFSLKHEETDQIQILFLSMEFAQLVVVGVIVCVAVGLFHYFPMLL